MIADRPLWDRWRASRRPDAPRGFTDEGAKVSNSTIIHLLPCIITISLYTFTLTFSSHHASLFSLSRVPLRSSKSMGWPSQSGPTFLERRSGGSRRPLPG